MPQMLNTNEKMMFILNEIIKKFQLILPLRHCHILNCLSQENWWIYNIPHYCYNNHQHTKAWSRRKWEYLTKFNMCVGMVHTLCEKHWVGETVELSCYEFLGESLVFIIWISHVAVKFINFSLKSRKLFYAAYQKFSNFPHHPLNREFCVCSFHRRTLLHTPTRPPEKN